MYFLKFTDRKLLVATHLSYNVSFPHIYLQLLASSLVCKIAEVRDHVSVSLVFFKIFNFFIDYGIS